MPSFFVTLELLAWVYFYGGVFSPWLLAGAGLLVQGRGLLDVHTYGRHLIPGAMGRPRTTATAGGTTQKVWNGVRGDRVH